MRSRAVGIDKRQNGSTSKFKFCVMFEDIYQGSSSFQPRKFVRLWRTLGGHHSPVMYLAYRSFLNVQVQGGLVRQSSNFVPVLWFRVQKMYAVLFRTDVFQTMADLRGTVMF